MRRRADYSRIVRAIYWVTEMRQDAFDNVLPLLRRTIATFSVPERRSIGERILAGRPDRARAAAAGIDEARADRVMPILVRILGVQGDLE